MSRGCRISTLGSARMHEAPSLQALQQAPCSKTRRPQYSSVTFRPSYPLPPTDVQGKLTATGNQDQKAKHHQPTTPSTSHRIITAKKYGSNCIRSFARFMPAETRTYIIFPITPHVKIPAAFDCSLHASENAWRPRLSVNEHSVTAPGLTIQMNQLGTLSKTVIPSLNILLESPVYSTATSAKAKPMTIDCIAQNKRHFWGTVKKNLSAFSSWSRENGLRQLD